MAEISKEIEKKMSERNNLNKAINFIIEKASHKWQDLAHAMGADESDIAVIKLDHPNLTKHQCRYYLQEWQQAKGDSATVNALCTALSECRLQQIRNKLEEQLGIVSQALGTKRKRTASNENNEGLNKGLTVKHFFYECIEPELDKFTRFLKSKSPQDRFMYEALKVFGGTVQETRPGCIETDVKFMSVEELKEFHDTMTAARLYMKRFITREMKIAAGLDPEGDYIALPCINERQYQDILQSLKDVEKGYRSDSDLPQFTTRGKLAQKYRKSQQALSAARDKISKLKTKLRIKENVLTGCEQDLTETKKKKVPTATLR